MARARELQAERFSKLGEVLLRTNAEADGELLDKIAAPDPPGRELLLRATERMHLTARGYHRVLRVARTIADLDGAAQIRRAHIAEALLLPPHRAGTAVTGTGRRLADSRNAGDPIPVALHCSHKTEVRANGRSETRHTPPA